MGKSIKRWLSLMLTAVLVTTNIPVSTAYAEDSTADSEVAVIEAEDETPADGISWSEPTANWYEDYEYTPDDGGTITISASKGTITDTNIVIPAKAQIGEKEYNVVLDAGGNCIWKEDRTKLTGIKIAEGVKTTADCSYMFANMEKLTELDVSGLDTSDATNMTYMFLDLKGLTSLDVSKLNTSKVTNLTGMFRDDYKLTSLTLTGLDTSAVTVMDGMFYNCAGLTSLDISGLNTSACTSMTHLFDSCKGLTTLDISKLDTKKVTNMNSMFAGLIGISQLDLSTLDTTAVMDMTGMFWGCSALTGIDVSHFDTSEVKYFNSMFRGCATLTSLDLSSFDTSEAKEMKSMFSGCKKLTTLNLGNMNTSHVIDMGMMFDECFELPSVNLGSFNTALVKNFDGMFRECRAMQIIDLRNFDFSASPEEPELFLRCAVKDLYLPVKAFKKYDFAGPTQLSRIFYAGSEEAWTTLENTKPNGVTITYNYTGEVLPLNGSEPEPEPVDTAWYEDYAYSFEYNSFADRNELVLYAYLPKDPSKVPENLTVPGKTRYKKPGEEEKEYYTVLKRDHSQFGMEDDYEASKRSLWNGGRSQIKKITLEEGCVLGSDCYRLFSYMSRLESVDLSKVKADEASNMRAMFYYCPMLKTVDFGTNFDCKNVTTMENMFGDCDTLHTLDLSGVNSVSVENMAGMLIDCHKLKHLTLGGKFTTRNVKTFAQMFASCDRLTSIDTSALDTSSAVILYDMFSDCERLESLDLSGFVTANVDDMLYMFNQCYSLREIKFGTAATAPGLDIAGGLFKDCVSVRVLDLRTFDFTGVNGSVNNPDNIFSGCGVTELYLPVTFIKNFDFTKEVDYSAHGTAAPYLKKIYYAGTEDEWNALGNTMPEGIEYVYGYTGAVKDPEGNGTYYVEKILKDDNYFEIEAGKEAVIPVTILPADATDKTLTWSIEDKSIASIDNNGKIKGIKSGFTFVNVSAKTTAGGKEVSARISITVTGNGGGGGGNDPDPVESADPIPGSGEATDPQPVVENVASQSITLVKGQKFLLADKDWKVSSSTPKGVVSVSKGNVTAKKAGTATLKRGSGENEQSITITVLVPVIEKKEKTLKLEAGAEAQLSFSGKKAVDGTIAFTEDVSLPVRFVSAAPDVATVDGDGNVSALTKGSAAITAYINGVAHKFTVKVSEQASPLTRTVHLNLTKTKNVKIKGLSKTEWVLAEDSDEGVVEIIKGSKVKAIKPGTVTLKCGDYTMTVIAEDPSISGSSKPYAMKAEMKVGETKPVSLTAVEQDVFFKSSKSSVAYMDAEGVIHARSKGKAKLTAKINGQTITIKVTVK